MTYGKHTISDERYAAKIAQRKAVAGHLKSRAAKKGEQAKKLPEVKPPKEKPKRPDGRVSEFPKEKFLDFCHQLMIQSKDSGVVRFELLETQRYLLDEIVEGLERGVTTFVILKNRQAGISTFFLALDLFEAFQHPGTIGVFATHDEGSRDQFRNQIEVFLQGLPRTHKIGYSTNNRLQLVLDNLSLFRYLVAGTRTTTNKLGRSGGCNYAHCTEVAFWGSEDDIAALTQTFSEKYPHRKYFWESTANGFNHYEEMWRIASESPAQKAIFIGWWRDERNEFSAEHPLYLQYMPDGVHSRLSALEKTRMKEVKELYDYDITAGQIAWYRYHLENKCKNDQSMMDQEQPWTAEHAFITSGANFFQSDILTESSREAIKHKCVPYNFRITDDFLETTVTQTNAAKNADLKIWEMPKGAKYVIGADPIFGSADNRDNGVISIFRCYGDCCVQVAEYVNDGISPHQYAWVIAYLAGLYSDVLLVLELNGPGTVVFQELKQLRQKLASYPVNSEAPQLRDCLKHMKNFLYTRSDSLSGNCLLQWKSSPDLRNQLLYKFHDGITTKRCRLRSMRAIDEIKYLTIDQGYISVPSGKTDDRVFGAALAYWGWDMRVRQRLSKQIGMTIIESDKRELEGDQEKIVQNVHRYLRNAEILTP